MQKSVDSKAKILSQSRLLEELKTSENIKKTIVTYNGSFDVLHAGHIQAIEEAKRQGDILIILLNSDSSIKQYKGSSRPIIPEKERAILLAALTAVDYVVLFDEINPKKVLDKIKPNIHCNGSDWGYNCIEREVVEKNGGKIHVLAWKDGYSTTKLIARINSLSQIKTTRAIFIDRDGTINHNGQGYTYKKEDIVFLEGTYEALKQLSQTEYKIIIVTNQSGIGRGMFTQEEYNKLEAWMKEQFKNEGIRIDKIYHCPHAPTQKCNCRKPDIGMIEQAVKDFDISLNESWMIGDGATDILMAREANIKSIKLGDTMSAEYKLEPNYYAESLSEGVNIILR